MYAIMGLLGTFLMLIVFPIMLLVLLFKVIRKTSTKKDKTRPFICLAIAIVLVVIAVKTTPDDAEKNEAQEIAEKTSEVTETAEKAAEEPQEVIEEQEEEPSEEEKKTDDDVFLEKSNEYLETEQSNMLLMILKDKIGFEKIVFVEKLGETFNYKITADGYELVATDLEDDFRIFIPNSSYVLYEDSKVIMTKENLKDKTVTRNEASAYYNMAQEIIISCLKNPKSADFPSIIFSPDDIGFKKNGNLVLVQSYVDATNSFGATIRSKWEVQFEVLDMETYTYDLKYINFDGEISGNYIEME
jgi:hypothetical protein